MPRGERAACFSFRVTPPFPCFLAFIVPHAEIMVAAAPGEHRSPVCRSPLSQHSFRPDSPGPIHISDKTSRRPRHANAPDDPDPRRPSSQSITLSPRRLSTSRSLVGSYTLSLLSSRMSAAHPTHHVPSAFTLKIGSVSPGGPTRVRSALRCPEHVKIAFDARWYELEGRTASAAWTPWVGNVDVEGWYRHQRRTKTLEWARSKEGETTPDIDTYYERILKGWIPTSDDILRAPPADRPLLRRMRCPPRPGYEVGVSGKMQFFIMQTLDQPSTSATAPPAATATTTPVKVFLVDYDLTSLEPGGRLLYKERAYQTIHEDSARTNGPSSPLPTTSPSAKPRAREVLKYAFELHFVCTETTRTAKPADPTLETIKRKRAPATTGPSRSYYLGKQIRLVFPTSSTSLNTTDGNPATATATKIPSPVQQPSVRVERLIEVQNPVPTSDDPPAACASTRSGSFTSESWQGLRSGRWEGDRIASSVDLKQGQAVDPEDSARAGCRAAIKTQTPKDPPAPVVEELPAATSAAALIFARSPTPIQPLTLKSPSLLSARLEEMSGLSPQAGIPGGERDPQLHGEEPSRISSPAGGRKRTLWPPDDTERLLSESLQKLPVSYR